MQMTEIRWGNALSQTTDVADRNTRPLQALDSKLRQKIPPEVCDKTRHRLPEQKENTIDKRLPSKRSIDNTRAMGLEDSVRKPGEWTELEDRNSHRQHLYRGNSQ